MKQLILKQALKNAYNHEGEAQVKPVLNKVLGEKPELKKDMSKLGKKTSEVVKKVNNMSVEQQEKKLMKIYPEALEEKEEEQGLPELPGKTDKVVMRFAPYPSGPLHLGHAKQAIPNYYYSKEKYDGKFLLVIDDTIGSKAKRIDPKAYDMIKEDMKWMKLDYDEVHLKSDRMEKYYEWAEKVIDKEKAYVCKCPVDKLRNFRKEKRECIHRKQSKEKVKEEFNKMLKGEYSEGEAVLRIKTDMKHKDPAFRDRVILRISEQKHPKTGKKYHVWPLLDFSWAVDDYLLGMTHILRGKDLLMETKMEKYIWDVLGIDYSHVEFIHTGIVNIEGIGLSSSEARRKIESGEYKGWKDPRTWSIQSLKARGITPEAIKKFILSTGVSKSSSTVPIDNLYSENRKTIDSKTRRFYFVPEPKKLIVKGIDEVNIEVPMHPNGNMGEKKYSFSEEETFYISGKDWERFEEGDKVRLKGAITVEVTSKNDQFIESKFLGTDIKADSGNIVQWVTENHVPVSVTLVQGDVQKGYGEKHLKKVEEEETIQFERYGFVKISEKGEEIKTTYSHN